MPAQTVDVTTNGITSKVRAASLAEPAPAPQPLPEKPMDDETELRKWCYSLALDTKVDTADRTATLEPNVDEAIENAQKIYDWVTQADKVKTASDALLTP